MLRLAPGAPGAGAGLRGGVCRSLRERGRAARRGHFMEEAADGRRSDVIYSG